MTIGGKALLLIKLAPIYGRSCCDSCPSACLKLLLVILRSFPACILMSVGPEAMADVARWCQEKRLDLGEEPRPRALFYFFGRMDCLFCWPRRRCFLLAFARNPLVAVDVNKRWSDCKGAVSLGKSGCAAEPAPQLVTLRKRGQRRCYRLRGRLKPALFMTPFAIRYCLYSRQIE